MPGASQNRVTRNYRSRLRERGLTRFEVLGRESDRELIRLLARRLADNGPEAVRLRTEVARTIATGESRKGGVLEALLRSPLVGADLAVDRAREAGRKVDL